MDFLTDQHVQSLLIHPWLVKADPADASRPYFFKAHVDENQTLVLITDLERVWAEVLSPSQARSRWTACNPNTDTSEWRSVLGAAHTSAGVDELLFEHVESTFSDLSFRIEYEGGGGWSWRWETIDCGPRLSARILAAQLLRPLLSLSHLALTNGGFSDDELASAIDKTARAARRMPDTHAKHAAGRPRPASALCRMAGLLSGLTNPLPIESDPEPPSLGLDAAAAAATTHTAEPAIAAAPAAFLPARPLPTHDSPPPPQRLLPPSPPPRKPSPPTAAPTTSVATDRGGVPALPPTPSRPRGKLVRRVQQPSLGPLPTAVAGTTEPPPSTSAPPARATPPPPEVALAAAASTISTPAPTASSDTESDASSSSSPVVPPPPRKKARATRSPSSSSDDEDSEARRRRYVARVRAGVPPRSAPGGARQPLQRGPRRF